MLFDNMNKLEAIKIPYNWGVDYLDGTYLKEYVEDGNRNDYYSINVRNIDRFGLFGSGLKAFYTRDGAFYINGRRVDIEYHAGDKVYGLTSFYGNRDCITFKDAHVRRNVGKTVQDTIVDAINFGYKVLLPLGEKQAFFQAVVMVRVDGYMEMHVKATANDNIDGSIVFKDKNGVIDSFEFPLQVNISSNINWIIR